MSANALNVAALRISSRQVRGGGGDRRRRRRRRRRILDITSRRFAELTPAERRRRHTVRAVPRVTARGRRHASLAVHAGTSRCPA